ncbi:MAG TPA: hypothetical protein VJG49_02270, partial [Candidatus Nanoarchaeia archaeon]|nr:hypothetical protein [Candidatus Nanoarchaeia archaeon]
MEQRHSESKEEFQRTKTELSQLRSALNQVHDEKEKAYHELQAWRMKLHTLTDKIRVLKQERDQFTIQVQSTKAERETLHQAEQQQRLEKQHADEKKKELITEVE